MKLTNLAPGTPFKYLGLGNPPPAGKPPVPTTLPPHILLQLQGAEAVVMNLVTGVIYQTHASDEIE